MWRVGSLNNGVKERCFLRLLLRGMHAFLNVRSYSLPDSVSSLHGAESLLTVIRRLLFSVRKRVVASMQVARHPDSFTSTLVLSHGEGIAKAFLGLCNTQVSADVALELAVH